jgi:class 3 adenylate cyclase
LVHTRTCIRDHFSTSDLAPFIGKARRPAAKQAQQQSPIHQFPSSASTVSMQSGGRPSSTFAASTDEVEHEIILGSTDAENTSPFDNGRDDSADTPEALVRKETQQLRIVRAVALVALIMLAVIMTSLIYILQAKSERSKYEEDYNRIARDIVGRLLDDSAQYVLGGYTLSRAMQALIQAYDTEAYTMAVPFHTFSDLSAELKLKTTSDFLSWSPLLRNDNERQVFEDFVRKKAMDDRSTAYPPCFVCGGPDFRVTSPEAVIQFPGNVEVSCGELDAGTRNGMANERQCEYILDFIDGICECGPVTHSKLPLRSVEEGICRMNFKTPERGQTPSLVNETWDGGPYLPLWQDSFIEASGYPLLYNLLSEPTIAEAVGPVLIGGRATATSFITSESSSYYNVFSDSKGPGPSTIVLVPVFDGKDFDGIGEPSAVGIIASKLVFSALLQEPPPMNAELLDIVIDSSCEDQKFTYRIDPVTKSGLALVGSGDMHEGHYSGTMRRSDFKDFHEILTYYAMVSNQGSCTYRFAVYSTKEFEDKYITNRPWISAVVIIVAFLCTSTVFTFYDVVVRRRQNKVMESATRTNDIVTALFPATVRDRLYKHAAYETQVPEPARLPRTQAGGLHPISQEASIFGSEPIADFFPSTTVAFIDIANFTGWCSERDPTQVFTLLENLYHKFDQIGKQHGIFKVETIGDSYVAIAGVPTPRQDHAIAIVRFASQCLLEMDEIVKDLETSLGPSTGDLQARVGIHSGPVTAGVLRGTKARFQLFGDTVNTGARMESLGKPHMIHATSETVALLREAGFGLWATPREEKIRVKGKGLLQTFWVNEGVKPSHLGKDRLSVFTATSEDLSALEEKSKRTLRLVNWNVSQLHSILERLVAARSAAARGNTNRNRRLAGENATRRRLGIADLREGEQESCLGTCTASPVAEMTQIIEIPEFDPAMYRNVKPVELNPQIKQQLFDFVSDIAARYRDVPFHNFDHASHVVMSASKLMKRIMLPDGIDGSGILQDSISRDVHRITYGLSSDLLLQFAVVFSGLIHDVDHTGLTNKELSDINDPVAGRFEKKCVAEQNSVQIAWDMLMNSKYKELRECIFESECDKRRFRELVVDAVLATDIADKDLGVLRKSRWEDAFSGSTAAGSSLDRNRRATIVFEHIIQASDVSHCMQHWHTYQRFNERLFEERYLAYLRGVAGDKPPWAGWYNGELWFFDNYIIPLAHKLKECGVFGVSYDEFLNYAQENRLEWEREGNDIVQALRAKMEGKYGAVEH